MTFNFIFRQGLPGTYCYNSTTKTRKWRAAPFRCFCITFIKTCSWKSLTKSKVKGHIYLDKFVMGSIYVIKYRFSRKSRKSGFLSSWVHLRACPDKSAFGLLVGGASPPQTPHFWSAFGLRDSEGPGCGLGPGPAWARALAWAGPWLGPRPGLGPGPAWAWARLGPELRE